MRSWRTAKRCRSCKRWVIKWFIIRCAIFNCFYFFSHLSTDWRGSLSTRRSESIVVATDKNRSSHDPTCTATRPHQSNTVAAQATSHHFRNSSQRKFLRFIIAASSQSKYFVDKHLRNFSYRLSVSVCRIIKSLWKKVIRRFWTARRCQFSFIAFLISSNATPSFVSPSPTASETGIVTRRLETCSWVPSARPTFWMCTAASSTTSQMRWTWRRSRRSGSQRLLIF